MKEGNIIKVISKHECKYLRDNGYGWATICGHGKYHRLYVVEDTRILCVLDKFRESIKIKTKIK